MKCNSRAVLPPESWVSWSLSLAWRGLDPTSIPVLFPSAHLSCAPSFVSYYLVPRESLQGLSMNKASPIEICPPVVSGLAGTLSPLRMASGQVAGGRIGHQVEPRFPEMESLRLCKSPTVSVPSSGRDAPTTSHGMNLNFNLAQPSIECAPLKLAGRG